MRLLTRIPLIIFFAWMLLTSPASAQEEYTIEHVADIANLSFAFDAPGYQGATLNLTETYSMPYTAVTDKLDVMLIEAENVSSWEFILVYTDNEAVNFSGSTSEDDVSFENSTGGFTKQLSATANFSIIGHHPDDTLPEDTSDPNLVHVGVIFTGDNGSIDLNIDRVYYTAQILQNSRDTSAPVAFSLLVLTLFPILRSKRILRRF